ncbi:unnamed protein product [Oppiella nova]|uniref:Uncharacterized protein n=1 Tax=Oppiella nova TaxID=334625 RepID=A0A7R9MST0_9ACAR|nr:unnamed protein product [Oppiella nova]CAG2182888.1 unnamed protein product [Oppiella nova]
MWTTLSCISRRVAGVRPTRHRNCLRIRATRVRRWTCGAPAFCSIAYLWANYRLSQRTYRRFTKRLCPACIQCPNTCRPTPNNSSDLCSKRIPK